MWKWILLLLIVVLVLGYIQGRRAKKEKKEREGDFVGCEGGCTGCANNQLCSQNQNIEKK